MLRAFRPVRPALALVLCTALAGCGSGSDGGTGLPGDSGVGDTSQFNPDLDDNAPPSSTPGGDSLAVAGLWNASMDDSEGGPAPEAWVHISNDGLWTRYDIGIDNCYVANGPYTLTLEDEANNGYSLPTEDEGLTLVVEDGVLTYRLGVGGESQSWERANGQVSVESLESQTCAG